jgi:hypothetical protein
MQIGAADAAGADFYQRRFVRNFGPRHSANDRLRAGTIVGAHANLFHERILRPFGLLIAVAWAEASYVNEAKMPISFAAGKPGRGH